MVFVMRKLDRMPQALGEKLRALRHGQAVTLAIMERETHVQRRYLEALERGRYELLPEPMYTRNFIRAYARVLSADADYFIELYEEECGRCDLVAPSVMPRQRIRTKLLFAWNTFLKGAAIACIAFGIVGYLGWQLWRMTAPPVIVLDSPDDATMASSAVVHVQGHVDGEATVSIDGRLVVVNADQTFDAPVDLSKGLNVITVTAQRRYSREASVERRVVFDPQAPETVSLLP